MCSTVTNALLDPVDKATIDQLGCALVELQPGQVVMQSGEPEMHVYFPLTAVLSLMSTMENGSSAEVALVGREGMVGLAGVLAGSDSPTSCIVQIGGSCLRTSAAAVRAARLRSDALRAAIDRYITARLIHVAQVAACGRLHPIGSRLARWLLALSDRADVDQFRLSQQHIADSLGVQRPTIALELQRLDAAGAIVYQSRTVSIANRVQLESLACECHAALHREYVSLFSPVAPPPSQEPVSEGDVAIEALRGIAGRLLVASLREQEARELAEAASREKDHLLAMISHELRTPIQAILGWCMLARQPNAPPGAIDVIERNARAQLTLINDLLDAARINARTLRIAPAEIRPASIIESALDTVRPAAEAKHIEIKLNVLDEQASLVGDADRLRQVLVNVLMNSVKFSDEGGCVDAEVSSQDQRVELRVTDHGRGISAKALPHVFERFWQEDAGNNPRGGLGLGLGLSISRALIELHGGTITIVSSGEGQGATCTITLPRPHATPVP